MVSVNKHFGQEVHWAESYPEKFEKGLINLLIGKEGCIGLSRFFSLCVSAGWSERWIMRVKVEQY